MAKILLVEDDTNLSEIYQARLEAEGYIVVAATEGETALALAAKEKPDLILSDVMMPKISGFEMLDILRNTEGLKHTKVIMLTALGQAEDKTRAEALGADRYLVKSQVTLEDIVTAAHELLNDPAVAPEITAAPVAAAAAPAQTAPTGPLEPTIQPATPPLQASVQPPVPSVTVAPAPAPAPVPVTPLADTGQLTQMAVSEPPQVPPAPATADSISAPADPAGPTAATPSPAPEPMPVASMPVPEPVVEPAPTVSPAPDTSTVIAEVPAPEPAPSLESAAGTVAAAPVDQPAAGASAVTGPIDESVVANAIDKLLAKTPGGTPGDNTSAAPSTVINPTAPAEKFHKKVVSPPEHVAAPSLQELLAKEEAKTAGTSETVPSAPAPADTKPFDPNSVAL